MKKLTTAALALVLSLGMTVTAFAAPSVSKDVTVAKDAVVDAQGNKIENVTVKVDASAVKAETKTEAVAKAKEVVGEKASVVAVVEVSLEGYEVSAEKPVTITFNVPGVKAGDNVSALHQKADGTWEKLAGKAGDGTITVTFTSLSPVAFVVEEAQAVASEEDNNPAKNDQFLNASSTSSDASAASSTVSPKTGEAGVVGLVAVAALCGAGLVLVNKKKTA